MRRELRSTVFLTTAAMLAAACSDQSTSTVTAPQATRASIAGTLALTCAPSALTPLATAYAASADDPLFTIIAALQSSSAEFHRTAATTDLAFDGLSRLAAMRGTSAQKSGATGATFDALTKGFLGCTESYIASTVPSTFSVAGALGAGWMFEVRGNSGKDGAAGAYARGSTPYWAAEPETGRTWSNSLVVTAPPGTTATNRVLVYGFRLNDYSTLDPKVGNAFEIATIPTVASGVLALVPSLHIGLCTVDLTTTARVQHVVSILPNAGLSCATPPVFAAAGASFARSMLNPVWLASKAVGFFAPATLQAAFIVGSVGGAVSELSPSAVIDMQKVTMDFDLVVKDGRNSEPLQGADGGPVKVSVGTLNGSPLEGATVTLSIAGNNGKPAMFKDGSAAPSQTVTRVTDANGVATFTGVSLTKAGGYRLTATGSFDGVDGVPVTSNLFNIKNK